LKKERKKLNSHKLKLTLNIQYKFLLKSHNIIEIAKMRIQSLLLISLFGAYQALYTSLQFSQTSSFGAKIIQLAIWPMPIKAPGVGNITFVGTLYRAINGPLKTSLNIVRTVKGIPLKVNW
jgi:hypothetical protein